MNLILADKPQWQERALCAQTDPEAFFPEKGGSTAEAKRICRRCEVQTECLEWALENHERFGIFGGLSERERRKLERKRAASANSPVKDIAAAEVPPVVKQIRRLAEAGQKDTQIGAEVGLQPDRVYRLRKEHGIKGGRPIGPRSAAAKVRVAA